MSQRGKKGREVSLKEVIHNSVTGPCDENSRPLLTVRASLKTTQKNSCSHKEQGCYWIGLPMTRVWGTAVGLLEKSLLLFSWSCFFHTQISSTCLSPSDINRPPQEFTEQEFCTARNNKGRSGRRLQEDLWRFKHILPANARWFVCPVPFFVMWRCRCQSSPLGLQVTFPFFTAAFLGLGLPLPFFFNDSCPAWSPFLTSPLPSPAFLSLSGMLTPEAQGEGCSLWEAAVGSGRWREKQIPAKPKGLGLGLFKT